MMMIIPVQWRDYKSKKEVIESFFKDEDFRVCCPIGKYSKWDTMACNKSDLVINGINWVKVRFNKLQDIVIIKVEENL